MSEDYKELVKKAYSKGLEDRRAANAGDFGMEFAYTKKFLSPYIGKDADIVELGCGTGYYASFFANQCKSYHGVDLSPVNIELMRQKIKVEGFENVTAQVGDATALPSIDDDRFDVVLSLGPLYHLNHEDRRRSIAESLRICKRGGMLAFAYINKAGVFAKFGSFCGWSEVLKKDILDCVLEKGTDNDHPEVFFYTTPEELQEDVENAGLKIIGSYGLDTLLHDTAVAKLTQSEREQWFRLADFINTSPSCVGLSNHALMICRKDSL